MGELNPNEWDVNDVAHFLRVNDCAAYCDNFAKKVKTNLVSLSLLCKVDDMQQLFLTPLVPLFYFIEHRWESFAQSHQRRGDGFVWHEGWTFTQNI